MKRLQHLILIFICTVIYESSIAQSQPVSSSEVYHQLNQFATTGTVMYIAAHPDDENTRLISYLTNSAHYHTIYLSLTRGGGGQNLIGTETGDLLGLLRTQELLEARKIDGGKQWFTSAIDFGYSKTATETLQVWDKERVLGDIVYAIRLHKPDVIITRFDPDSNGKTHGHHTASAQLAVEAFDLANDPRAYPEQLESLTTWQPNRLFFNTSWWFYGSREKFDAADKSNLLSVDVGEYYPLLGTSNNEIASRSRSKHICQGFGSELQRGSQLEWLELLKGDMPTNGDIMQGVANRWKPDAQKTIQQLQENFNFNHPEELGWALLSHQNLLRKNFPSAVQESQYNQLVQHSLGIYSEVTTRKPFGINKDSIELTIEVVNRSSKPIPNAVVALPNNLQVELGELSPNKKVTKTQMIQINEPFSNSSTPYYLTINRNGANYGYRNQLGKNGKPMNRAALQYELQIELTGFNNPTIVGLGKQPIVYKHVQPDKGELYEPFYVVPPVAVNILEPVHLLANSQPKAIQVEVISFVDNAKGLVNLEAGMDWMISEAKPYEIQYAGERQVLEFIVLPPKQELTSELRASVSYDGQTYFNRFDEIDYPHIQKQIVFTPSTAKLGKLDMKLPTVKIAYLMGSGDEIPASLRQFGLQVNELSIDEISPQALEDYDVFIFGIRAMNTIDGLTAKLPLIWAFAKNGGTIITQYNTNRNLKVDAIAPYPLTIGRDRIADETATLHRLVPYHKVFTIPNQIEEKDFDNWVQERGLYFADEFADAFTPLLRGNDVGETPKDGALLIAEVGDGYYVYTGLSFFRELPAGVPGAYRLFMNLLALGDEK